MVAVGQAAADLDAGDPVEPSREAIEGEIARIEATGEFARAPVMRRLLRFLVETTLAGGGAALKAYSVAVDGLGRSPDFDSQSDSYPRVQVGRLRRMLASFYAQHGTRDGLRLTIPQGSYLVAFLDDVEKPAPAVLPPPPSEVRRARAARWRTILGIGVVGALLFTAALALGAWRWWESRFVEQHPGLTLPPTLAVELGGEAGASPDARLARSANAFLVDALRRSRLVRVHQGEGRGNDYRLIAEVSSGDQPTLFLRLWRNDINRLLWSGVVRLTPGSGGLQQALTPAIVELVQPFGVIGSDQRARHLRDFAPGYACLLQFDEYRRDLDHGLALSVDRCLRATLAIDPHQAAAIAARAMLLADAAVFFGPTGVDRSRLDRATTLAGQAVAVDPYSPDAHLAVARAAFLDRACARATESGRRALTLDPYDPDMLGRIGRFLADCGDPRGLKLVTRAIELDPDPPASFFTPLVLDRLAANDAAGALGLASRMTRPADLTAGLYEITLAAAYAANNRQQEAVAAWARAVSVDRTASGPEQVLARWQLPERSIDLVLGLLRKATVIPPLADIPAAVPAPAATSGSASPR